MLCTKISLLFFGFRFTVKKNIKCNDGFLFHRMIILLTLCVSAHCYPLPIIMIFQIYIWPVCVYIFLVYHFIFIFFWNYHHHRRIHCILPTQLPTPLYHRWKWSGLSSSSEKAVQKPEPDQLRIKMRMFVHLCRIWIGDG